MLNVRLSETNLCFFTDKLLLDNYDTFAGAVYISDCFDKLIYSLD